MIPTDLQSGLKARLKKLFVNKKFTDPDGELIPLHVFEQHLPEKPQEDISLFPYIIVQLLEGEQQAVSEPHTVKVLFIIGVYDESSDNQGNKEVMAIINKIFEDLGKRPIQSRRFELTFPIRWGLHEEDVAPYFFGAVETTWSAPAFMREDVEALI